MFQTLLVDLDDTVYPGTSGLWDAIGVRINQFMVERVHIPVEHVSLLRQHLYRTYGTTMRGLITEYQADRDEYLAFVHDVPLGEYIQPDPQVRFVLQNYPQKKVIFTNADVPHARRVLRHLQLDDLFEQIVDICQMDPYCKPQQEAFEIALKNIGNPDPRTCVFIDDSPKNLATGRQIGFYTIRVGSQELLPEYDEAVSSIKDLPSVLSNGVTTTPVVQKRSSKFLGMEKL